MPKFLHVLFNLVVKHSPVFFLAVLHFVSEKNEEKECTMNTMRWNKRKPFFKFLAPLLVRVDVMQVTKAQVHGG